MWRFLLLSVVSGLPRSWKQSYKLASGGKSLALTWKHTSNYLSVTLFSFPYLEAISCDVETQCTYPSSWNDRVSDELFTSFCMTRRCYHRSPLSPEDIFYDSYPHPCLSSSPVLSDDRRRVKTLGRSLPRVESIRAIFLRVQSDILGISMVPPLTSALLIGVSIRW